MKYISRPIKNVQNGLHLVRNRKTMWQMLRDTVHGEYRMSVRAKIFSGLAVLYILFPFDIIPDYIPVLGWIDDGFAFYLLLKLMNSETQRYARQKAIERKRQEAA
jgi:uncharacterized membrane protein YkvA (DUF1232 family)